MSLFVALAIAVAVTPLAGKLGEVLGVVDLPSNDPLKIHRRPIPLLGGIGVIAATLAAMAVVGATMSGPVAAAVLLALLVGVVDDVRSLPPWLRVLMLSGSGCVMAAGVSVGEPVVAYALGLVLLCLACANAVNILDGQDGLCGGVAALAALGIGGAAHVFHMGNTAALSLAVAGALVGFLLWNRPPARVFLGNGGAYAVGFLLAVCAAEMTIEMGWRGFFAAGVCLGVYAFESCYTIAARLATGEQLTHGDRLHSYDLLSRRFGSRTRSTLTLWAVGSGAASIGVGVALASPAVGAAFVVLAAACGVVAWSRVWAWRLDALRHSS